jgi:AGZA family xanthine/uracil permease-like MFS transporter
VKWYGPVLTASGIFENFSDVVPYLGLVIPLAISASANSMMCLVSAKEAGDPYPVHESVIIDVVGTCISSFFGTPFGTAQYVSTMCFVIGLDSIRIVVMQFFHPW